MKIPNLTELMVSISDFKKELSDIIKNRQTKVIVKNNEPVSVVMPYADYLDMTNNSVDIQKLLQSTGEDVTLSNGIQFKVLVEPKNEEGIAIKTYMKMKTSGEYKLHYTLHLGNPIADANLTNEEIMMNYESRRKKA